MNFRVTLDLYRGPLDLLLYLVRRHEVDAADLPIAPIVDQYLEYLDVLKELNIDSVGDFIETAGLLMEIKSRMILPQADEETDRIEDPRDELVERLLEYKKFKDAAVILEERSRNWQQRYPRMADDLPPRKIDPAEQPIHEVELWDLVSALGRILREHEAMRPSNIVYDEVPIQTHMRRIHRRLLQTGRTSLSESLEPGMRKSTAIGVFLAILELVRHHDIHAEQEELYGEIWLTPGEHFSESLDLGQVDDYRHGEEKEPDELSQDAP
jgi:segregation and condensation protein A